MREEIRVIAKEGRLWQSPDATVIQKISRSNDNIYSSKEGKFVLKVYKFKALKTVYQSFDKN